MLPFDIPAGSRVTPHSDVPSKHWRDDRVPWHREWVPVSRARPSERLPFIT